MKTILDQPPRSKALLVLAHGAGAGMRHPAMQALCGALHAEGIATLRYEFAYMEQGKKRPDPPAVAVARVAEAVEFAHRKFPKMELFAGGRSFGGRMTTTAASQGKIAVRGIICFSFPLHPAKKPSTDRAAHLKDVEIPQLWIQGSRDELADLKLTRKVTKAHGIALEVIPGADHGYHVLKSLGVSAAQVLEKVARAARQFIDGH